LGQVIDETGNQYGRLTVLGRAGSKRNKATWLCLCECGNEISTRGDSLRRGATKSCGCLQKEKASESAKINQLINEIGNRYGRLTVLRRAENQNGRTRWLCHCTCGKDVEVLGASLRNGCTQSCGCFQKEKASLPIGEAAFNHLLLQMMTGARRRGYSWNLTDKQFRQLTSQPCFYCGVEPSQRGATQAGFNGVYLYNGLDRIINKKGYTLENIVPCCGVCNRAKGKKTQDEFLGWISRLCAFHKIRSR